MEGRWGKGKMEQENGMMDGRLRGVESESEREGGNEWKVCGIFGGRREWMEGWESRKMEQENGMRDGRMS